MYFFTADCTPYSQRYLAKKEEVCLRMKEILIGMAAGSVVGAVAATVAMPYVRPHMKKAIKKGRKLMNCSMHKIMTHC